MKTPEISGNGIELEHFGREQLKHRVAKIVVDGACRNADGSWSASVDIVLDLELPDGRRIDIRRYTSLRGRQVGRKPRVKRT